MLRLVTLDFGSSTSLATPCLFLTGLVMMVPSGAGQNQSPADESHRRNLQTHQGSWEIVRDLQVSYSLRESQAEIVFLLIKVTSFLHSVWGRLGKFEGFFFFFVYLCVFECENTCKYLYVTF